MTDAILDDTSWGVQAREARPANTKSSDECYTPKWVFDVMGLSFDHAPSEQAADSLRVQRHLISAEIEARCSR